MLYSLQIGRALAALAVVATHAAMATQALFPAMPALAYTVFRLGFLGVDYFFVLSGFIIAHATASMQSHTADCRRYTQARLIRIYVPYLPISLAMVAAFSLVPSLSMGTGNDYSLLGSLLLTPSNAMPALTVARTLQHEMVFYVLFGLCLFMLKRRSLIFLWALPMAIGLLFALPPWLEILVGVINVEFLLGMAAHALYRDGRCYAYRHGILLLGIATLALACAIIGNGAFIAHWRLLAGLGFALMVLGLTLMERTVDFGRFRVLVFLGAASYAVYLVHNPAMSVLLRLGAFQPHWVVALGFFVVVSTAAGVAYHWLIERPLMRYVRTRLGRGSRSEERV